MNAPVISVSDMTPAILLASPVYMRRWLEGKDPSEIVSDAMLSPHDCLGARFLRDHGYSAMFSVTQWHQRETVLVGKRETKIWSKPMKVPQWFQDLFVEINHITGHRFTEITAGDALTALNRVQ